MCVTPASTLIEKFCSQKRNSHRILKSRSQKKETENETEKEKGDGERGKKMFVICNRQPTEYDEEAELRFFCDSDLFFKLLLHQLSQKQNIDQFNNVKNPKNDNNPNNERNNFDKNDAKSDTNNTHETKKRKKDTNHGEETRKKGRKN
eukprot:TRINITY_DN6614_c0_g1_i1.p1 TRINITY_DN6614_c0_g1~~TRINITY_DN6614_c0_g1_i1.p1  ORF type:complete len:166 (+),score=55.56 TRINITY_DN6614_c0_g1_i1:55-498(+)